MTPIAHALSEATRYLRILHSVERAHALGSEDEVVSLLSNVDPVDLHEVATVLQTLSLSLEDSLAEPTEAAVTPQSPAASATVDSLAIPQQQSSARVVPIHNYSIKVGPPCR